MYKAIIVFTDGITKTIEYTESTITDVCIVYQSDDKRPIIVSLFNVKYIENE